MAAAAQTPGATTKVAAVWTNVPWHCWAFFAYMSNRDDNAQRQKGATAWTIAPWHCCPFLALLHDGNGNNISNANNGAQQ
jgi:hypothetical protein